MSTPNETKRNPWMLPGLILWGFAPTILMTSSMLGGWYSGDGGFSFPGRSPSDDQSDVNVTIFRVGLLGMPIILYPWGVIVLLWFGKKRTDAALLAIPIAISMGIANLFLSLAGCTGLSNTVPKEGIF